jgi:hypothetical protein
MGSYWTFSVDGYHLLSSKSYVDPVVMTVFTEADKSIREVRHSDPKTDLPAGGDSEEEYSFMEVSYVTSGSIVRDRLEVMGFTLRAARAMFEAGIPSEILATQDLQLNHEDISEACAEKIRLLKLLSFDAWLESFQAIKRKNIKPWDIRSWDLQLEGADPSVRDLPALERFVLSDDGFPFRLPPCDVRFLIRAVIEACGVSSTFRMDLSDLVGGGYYEITESVAENARVELASDYPLNTKVIVLTEGVTDRRVLEASLRLLYPHLADYYSFMDFDGANAPGGAGHLVNTVKAFAGAGIANRIVALFDNDTGARAALRGLDGVDLPPSVRVLQFPAIPIGANYPTSGPSGLVHMDVNGLAASLEMYLGEDVLRRADGTFTPVHWRGFDTAVRAYQGELEHKGELQNKFTEKLAAAATDPAVMQAQDWTGIRAILDMVRRAFENETG